MSGTADSSANPLFRRLGVTGGGITHFNGGRFGNASEPVSRDVLKLFAMVLREVSAKVVEVDCSDKVSIKGKKTSQRKPCDACGDTSGRSSRKMKGDTGGRFCNSCFAQHVRPGVCVDIINADARAFMAKIEDENFHITRNQLLDKLVEMINVLTQSHFFLASGHPVFD